MAVTPAFCPLSLQVLFNANALPIVGGSIFVYAAGTTQLVTTYADGGMADGNPNPLVSDAFGRIPPIYVGQGAYKVVAQDASGAQLFSIDNLPGGIDYVAQAAAAAQAAGSTLAQAQTGDVKFKHGSSSDAGWLWANGLTIGNAQTQAVARANADTQSLFVYLWNNDPALTVSGGRGVTATADFNAAKTITLPDYRGRVACGCDQMGTPATAGVITSASTPSTNTPGAQFGAETITLAAAQLPTIQPVVTIDNGQPGGVHSHVAATDSQGIHTHTGTTDLQGAHTHTFPGVSIVNTTSGSSYGGVVPNTETTASAGAHQHALEVDPGAGAHIHNVTVDGGVTSPGTHTHTVSCSGFGGGQAHSNVPPSILGYWHIKL